MMRIGQIFWGWFVVLGAFLLLCLSNGIRNSFGVFVPPIFQEFGWPMSAIAFAASLNLLVYSVGSIFCGRLADRLAPRWMITAGAILSGTGLYLLTGAGSPAGLYLAYGLLCGAGQACLGTAVCLAAVGKWFRRKRGAAIGFATMGIGVGTMAMNPVAGYLVSTRGWRAGFVVFAGLMLLAGTLIAQVLMGRTTPEASGLHPDGESAAPTGGDPGAAAGRRDPVSLKPLLGDLRFWVLALCNTLAVLTVVMTFVHQVNYAVGNRIGQIEAATALGLVGFIGGLGNATYGWLCDRVRDAKVVASLGYALMAAGTALLIVADTAPLLYLYAVVYGVGYGSMSPVIPYLLTDRFGGRVLGAAFGVLVFFAMGFGGFLGPLIGGVIYDRTGSYRSAWLLNLVLLLAASALILTLRSARGREGAR